MLPRLMPQLCLGPGSVGDGIMQWEKEDQEDLCLAGSYAPNCAKSQLSKPFFASFAGSQDWYFSCPYAGLVSCVSC